MKIAVLCGGVSTEREVSLKSGEAVERGLLEADYEASLVDITSISAFLDEKWPKMTADGVFIALHGGWGEDGRLQAALEAHDIPYTGSGPKACMEAMDKELSRNIFEKTGIPIPPGFAVTHDRSHDLGDAIGTWGKIVIKPASGGSTVGVAITSDKGESLAALTKIWDIDTKAIVEEFIPGRELTVAVFENESSVFAMPAIEIRPRSGFYDYESKYTSGATDYICPAHLPPKIASKMAEYACVAHTALGCRTYSRVDFRLDERGDLYALELNTAPGMTATSLVPKAALAYGWDFPRLLSELVKNSFAKHPR